MSMYKPLEALLRPPIEWMTSLSAWLVAFLYVRYPQLLLVSAKHAAFLALFVSLFGLYRFKQGYRIYRYQRNLKRMPTYRMTSKELPVSKHHLFLGRGFMWTTQHTQRIRDLDLSYNLHFKYPNQFISWARNKEFQWENKHWLNHVAKIIKKDHWLNPFRPYPPIGGEPCLHGISEHESDIYTSLVDRAGHMAVIGTTGVGKTRFAEILIGKDIRRGDIVIVLDPKGDADLLKRMYIEAKIAGREEDFLVLHLGSPPASCRYNPIGYFTKITQVTISPRLIS